MFDINLYKFQVISKIKKYYFAYLDYESYYNLIYFVRFKFGQGFNRNLYFKKIEFFTKNEKFYRFCKIEKIKKLYLTLF